MINQMNQNENTQNQFSNTIKEPQIGKLMRKSNVFMETDGQLSAFSKHRNPF